MRKVEKQMLEAIKQREPMFGRNTMVTINRVNNRAQVYLHGNNIADYCYSTGAVKVNEYTLARWPSVTTKSRLRALGVDVYTKDYVTYLNGQAVN